MMNKTDFFTRLLAGIAYTRLAPASFYEDPSGPDRHFDGMCALGLMSDKDPSGHCKVPAVMACVLSASVSRGYPGKEPCLGPM